MKKLIFILLLTAAAFVLLTACGRENPPPEETPPDETEEENYDIINPLTGEASDEDMSENRPYVFVLNNLKASLPQCGVEEADMYFEAVAEGGITRILGVFQEVENVGPIGSVRSARPYLVDIALSFDPIFIHAGGSDAAYSELYSQDVLHIDGVNGRWGTQIFYRDSERSQSAGYEHSLFTSGQKIKDIIFPMDDIRQTHKDGYSYGQTYAADGTPSDGDGAGYIKAYFSGSKSTSFEYDGGTGKYKVFDYDLPYIDGNTENQVSVTNVICLFTDISRISGDSSGRMNIRTTGGGDGYFACGGKLIPIRWQRDGVNSRFTYLLSDGTPLSLGRGTTYVCFLSGEDMAEYSEIKPE